MNLKNKNQKAILEFKNVKVKYHTPEKEILAIKNLIFDVYNEEFVTILGPSGSGKSTVLSIISGLLPITDGEFNLNVSSKNDTQKQNVGYMFQRDYLFDWRTIEQNVFLGLEIKKSLNDKTKNYAIELLKKYGLGDFLKSYPNELSGGMKQKVALIRTLAVNPEILLLDEPFSALDFQTRINLADEVRKIIKNEHKTAVLVSHDISEAISISDRIIVFSKRPSVVKKIFKIDFGNKKLTSHEKRNHKRFNEYFDSIWSEMSEV